MSYVILAGLLITQILLLSVVWTSEEFGTRTVKRLKKENELLKSKNEELEKSERRYDFEARAARVVLHPYQYENYRSVLASMDRDSHSYPMWLQMKIDLAGWRGELR